MGGFFGVASKEDCVADLFYGTDYHSHLGTVRGGMVVRNDNGFKRNIHDITNTPFRTKFEDDLPKHHGNMGLGVISDNEDQPQAGTEITRRVGIILGEKPETPVYVKADRAVPYGNVVGAMVVLQQAGATNIGFVTDPLDTYPVPE